MPHQPSPLQQIFLQHPGYEVFFGGAAGGGKSDALLMAALQFVDVPGYSAALFRLKKTDLYMESSILGRARQWWAGNPRVRWDDSLHGFRFATGGADATIHFGYGETLKEISDKYQGAEFQMVGIDELGQWREPNFLYLFSRVRRRVGVNVPLRVRGSGNPGGIGHEWVKARYIENAKHITEGSDVRSDTREHRTRNRPMPSPRVYVSPPSQTEVDRAAKHGREPSPTFFIPSFNTDNPGLDLAAYREGLSRLDVVTYRQLEDGDFDAIFSGKYFNAEMFAGRILGAEPEGVQWVRSWDTAATAPADGSDPDWSVGAKVGIQMVKISADVTQKRVIIANIRRARLDPSDLDPFMRTTSDMDGPEVSVVLEQEPGSAGKIAVHGFSTNTFFGRHVVTQSKAKGGGKAMAWLPLVTQAQQRNVWLVAGDWNQEFIRELCALPVGHDDQADAASQGYNWLARNASDERLSEEPTRPTEHSQFAGQL